MSLIGHKIGINDVSNSDELRNPEDKLYTSVILTLQITFSTLEAGIVAPNTSYLV